MKLDKKRAQADLNCGLSGDIYEITHFTKYIKENLQDTEIYNATMQTSLRCVQKARKNGKQKTNKIKTYELSLISKPANVIIFYKQKNENLSHL